VAGKLKRDSLMSEMAAVDGLLARLRAGDILGRNSLAQRKAKVQDQIRALDAEVRTAASVILSFDGGPVQGSRSIDAEFAALAIKDYQDLVGKQMAASETGGLARRGPVPAKRLAKLNIVNVVHGSFGFMLEESAEDEAEMFDTALRKSVEKVDALLASCAAPDQAAFEDALLRVDARVFLSLKSFIEDLHRDEAVLRIIEDENEIVLDRVSVERARARVQGTEVDEQELTVAGELLGIVPIQRKFEFRTEGGEVVSGQVGQRLSDDYLERIHGEDRVLGRRYLASMARRTVRRANGQTSTSHTLLDLSEPASGAEKI
jgi:hypothetical protein